MAAASILDFQTSEILLADVSGGPRHIIVLNVVKIGLSVAAILQFFEFSRCHLGFWNHEILLANGIQRVETHQCAIFRKNRSIGCTDIKIFRFSKMRPFAILDLFEHTCTTHSEYFGVSHSAKFGYDRCSCFYNMNISIFGAFGWKMRIQPQEIGVFWAIWSPKWAAISTNAKIHNLAWVVSFEPSSMKIWWAVWHVGDLHKRGINKKIGLYFIYLCRSPHGRISTKFCTAVEVVDLTTCDKYLTIG